MANVKALQSGLWGDTATWGGALPLSTDDVYANGFTVTIAQDRTANTVRNSLNTGIVAGGTFVLQNGVTLTAQVIGGTLAGNCVQLLGTASATIAGVINGYVNAGATNSSVLHASTGTLTINGNILGSTLACPTVLKTGTGSLIVNGTVTGGTTATSYGIDAESIGGVTVVGAVTGGALGPGIYNAVAGPLTITGNVTSGANAQGVYNNDGGVVTINGNVSAAPASIAAGLMNFGTGLVFINGNVTGGSGSTGYGINAQGPGHIEVVGDVTGGTITTCYGINLVSGNVKVTGGVRGGTTTSSGAVDGILSSGTTPSTITVINGPVVGQGGGSGGMGIRLTVPGDSLTVTGNVQGGLTTVGISSVAGTNVTVNGDVLGNGTSAINGMTIAGSLTVNGNITSQVGGGVVCTGPSPTVNGNITATGGPFTFAWNAGGTGTMTVHGNLVGGANSSSHGVSVSAAGVAVNVTGSCTAGTSSGSGLSVSGNNNIATVLGDCFGGGASANGVSITGAGCVLTVNGNCYGSNSTGGGVLVTGASDSVINGNCFGGNLSSSFGAQNAGGGTMTINGDVTGGVLAANYGAVQASTATMPLLVNGTAYGSPTGAGHGVHVATTTNVYVKIAQANNYPNDNLSAAACGVTGTSAVGAVTVDAMIDGSGGWQPVQTIRAFVREAGTNFVRSRQSNGGPTITMGEITDYPAPANVRTGITYNFGTTTGTCAVPPAASVLIGVPVGATVGIAAIDASTLFGPALKARMEKCSTVESVGAQLAAMAS
jgi:hypothetical protein